MKHWLCLFAAALAVSFAVISVFAGAVLLFKTVIARVGVKLFFALVLGFAALLMMAATLGGDDDGVR